MSVVDVQVPASRVISEVQTQFLSRDGKTQLSQSYCSSPLKIAKPFFNYDGSLELCIMDCSPGLLAGDTYSLQFKVEENAQAKVVTQSFAKVHPSKDNLAQQHINIEVSSGALFEYSPQPLILFRDAHLQATCNVDVINGGTLLMSDIICCGRVAHNEKFLFHCYQSKLQINYNGKLISCNQTRFAPYQQKLQSVASWNTSTHWGNFYYVGEVVTPELLNELRNILQLYPQLQSGASLMEHNGIVVSVLASQAWKIQEAFSALVSCVRCYLTVKF